MLTTPTYFVGLRSVGTVAKCLTSETGLHQTIMLIHPMTIGNSSCTEREIDAYQNRQVHSSLGQKGSPSSGSSEFYSTAPKSMYDRLPLRHASAL